MNPISAPVQAVLDLFTDPLRDVRFADVDAATLRDLAASTLAAAEVMSTAEAELTRARRALQERQDTLLTHAQRALAYARVYAETDAALTERLEQIALPRVAKRPRVEGDGLALQLQPDPAPRPRRAAPAKEGEEVADGPRKLRTASRAPKEEEPMLAPSMASTG